MFDIFLEGFDTHALEHLQPDHSCNLRQFLFFAPAWKKRGY